MFRGKARYLEKLTSKFKFKSIEVGESLEGSSPPSVFVGRYGYPKVFLGPMMSLEHESSLLDTPELWLDSVNSNIDIVNFRLQLVRGKSTVGIKDSSKYVESMREIVLAQKSPAIDAHFLKKPKGRFFNEEMQPFGPSGEIKMLEVENVKYNPHIEKAYYDTDLKAKDAILSLYDKGILFSSIQKTLSVGALGLKKNRKLVPTRWSITATDSMLSETFLEEIKQYETLGNFRVYEYGSLQNYFAILMLPTPWQYELIEAFIRVLGNEEVMFSDYELYHKKKEYAAIGGCYYSARLAVAEKLKEERKQAGIIILRESYPGYIPLGVWNVRENVRQAMKSYKEFEYLRLALNYISRKLWIPMNKWLRQSKVLKNFLHQRTLQSYQ